MKTNLVVIGVALFAIVVSNGLTHSVMRKEVEKVKVERDSIILNLYNNNDSASTYFLKAISSAIDGEHSGTAYNMSKAVDFDSVFVETYINSLNN